MIKKLYLWYKSHFYTPNGGKWWGYTEARRWTIIEDGQEKKMEIPALPCTRCKRKHRHRRYMIGLQEANKDNVLCILHYFGEVPAEVDKLLLRFVRPLAVASLIFFAVASISTTFLFTKSRILFRSAVTGRQIENVVNWAMTIAPNIDRETMTREIETVNEESDGNMMFFVAGVATLRVEGVFDPSHIGKMQKGGKWVPSGARGTGAVLESHLPDLIKAHVKGIREKTDLNHPVYGTRAAMFVLKQCRQTAKGNTMRMEKFYLQGEGTKYEAVTWNMSLEKYFDKFVNTMGEIALVLDSEDGQGKEAAKNVQRR